MASSDATMLSDRAVLRVTGDDPRGFLQGLVTQNVLTLAPDRPRWSALLTPQGKALFDFLLWAEGDAILVDCEHAQAEALARRLSMYRLRRAIDIAPADLAVHWARTGTAGVADPRLPELGRRWLGRPAEPADGWREHRLRRGVTEGVAELGSGETLWLECNAAELSGVDFAKGCYVGQENTARMHYRGKANRRLAVASSAAPGTSARATYSDLGLIVDVRRVDAWGDAIRPEWLSDWLGAH